MQAAASLWDSLSFDLSYVSSAYARCDRPQRTRPVTRSAAVSAPDETADQSREVIRHRQSVITVLDIPT